MAQATSKQPPFSIFESYAFGLRLSVDHMRLFAMLSVVPLIAAFASMVILRFTGGMTIFMLPLLQAPANFVQGLQCAIIVRFLLLQEFPLIADETQRRARNRDVMQSAVVYMIITYLFNGLMAAMMYMAKRLEADPEGMAPMAPIAFGAIIFMFWCLRWFWLFIPVALGWDIKGLFARLKGWQGSLRIGGLFIACSATISLITGLVRYLLLIVSGAGRTSELGGAFLVVDDGIVALSSVAMAILFSCASAHAIKTMTVKK